MITPSYINQEYVPRVDLETLGNSYNTLEQGHQAAVKAASDLRLSIAQMEMDSSEDWFKELLYNEIGQTIDNNTLYGNSYAALDDLVLKTGDIATDGRVVGRLRNHAAKKEYDAKVDAMNIPDGMKQMYKEDNPYYYEDGEVDPNTGRVKAGELWKPTTQPVTTIDRFKFMDEARKIVAAEAGGYDTVFFLDAAGNPTTHASKSADGSMYKQVGTKYEKISKDKIKEAIKLARASIAGAEDSFRQDYKYERYKYNKELEKLRNSGSDENPIVEGFTDDYGIVLEYEDWLDAQFDEFANLASYTHVYTNTQWGTALQAHNARKAAGSGDGSDYNPYSGDEGYADLGTYEVTRNAYSEAVAAKDGANNTGMKIIKDLNIESLNKFDNLGKVWTYLMNNKLATGPGTAAQYIINNYGQNMSDEDRLQLTNAFMSYYKSNKEVNNMLRAAGKDNIDALNFSANLNSQIYTNDNVYGRAINETVNWVFERYDTINIRIGENVFENLKKRYSIRNWEESGMTATKNDYGEYVVSITKQNQNLLPKLLSELDYSFEETPGNFGTFFKRNFTWFRNLASDSGYSIDLMKDGKKVNNVGTIRKHLPPSEEAQRLYGDDIYNKERAFADILNNYRNGKKNAENIQKKIGNYEGVKNLLGTTASTRGEIYIEDIGNRLGWSKSDIDKEKDKYTQRVDRAIAAGDLAGGEIYYLGGNLNNKKGDVARFEKQVANATELDLLIQHMYTNYASKIARIYSPGDDNIKEGYKISFTVPENDENDITKKYRGKTMSLYVTGSIDDGSGYDISNNPTAVAKTLFHTSRATGAHVENLGYTKSFGDTRMTPNIDGSYNTTFIGRHLNLNQNDAENLTIQYYNLELLKADLYHVLSNNNLTNEQKSTLIANSTNAIIKEMSNATGVSQDIISAVIRNYLKESEI